MQKLIDADALKDDILKSAVMIDDRGIQTGYEIAIELIKRQPTIDAEPVRHAKWIESDEYDEFSGRLYRCSNCNTFVIGDIDNYCPFCGARMDKQETNDAAGKV